MCKTSGCVADISTATVKTLAILYISMIFSPLSRMPRLVPNHPHTAGLSVYRQNRWSTSTTPEQEMTSHTETIQDLICSTLLMGCSQCTAFLIVGPAHCSRWTILCHLVSRRVGCSDYTTGRWPERSRYMCTQLCLVKSTGEKWKKKYEQTQWAEWCFLFILYYGIAHGTHHEGSRAPAIVHLNQGLEPF